jgi:hypothetical protein
MDRLRELAVRVDHSKSISRQPTELLVEQPRVVLLSIELTLIS